MQKNRNSTIGKLASVISLFFMLAGGTLKAQYSIVSVGLMVGDPIGITMKYSLGIAKALDVSFGPDYFGSPRLQIDKIYLYNTFSSSEVKMYAGMGLAIAFAKGTSNMFYSKEPGHESFTLIEDIGFQLGARTIFGLSITPKNLPFNIFLETGPLFALSRAFEIDFDAAIGVRVNL